MSFLAEGPGADGRRRQSISEGAESEIDACFKRDVKPVQTSTHLFSERIKEVSCLSARPFPTIGSKWIPNSTGPPDPKVAKHYFRGMEEGSFLTHLCAYWRGSG